MDFSCRPHPCAHRRTSARLLVHRSSSHACVTASSVIHQRGHADGARLLLPSDEFGARDRIGDLTMISSIDLRLSSSRRMDSARGARCAAVISPGGLCGMRSRARDQLAQKSSGSGDPTVATECASGAWVRGDQRFAYTTAESRF